MSYIVFAQPRSGSTALMDVISNNHFIAHSKPISNFLEFFNPFCVTTYGELYKLYRGDVAVFLGTPLSIRVLRKDVIDASNAKQLEFKRLNWNPMDFFEEKTITFNNTVELSNFVDNEQQVRFDFVTTITNYDIIIKHFVIGILLDEKLLSAQNTTKIFYYRQNLIDSVLSSLIKTNYFDYPANNAVSYLKGTDAHNWAGLLKAFMPDGSIMINENMIRNELIYTVNLLKFYQAHKSKFDKIYCHETVFQNNASELNTKLTSMKRMPYTAKKERYFANSEIIPDVVKSVLQENNLQDVVEELGIIT
jgi:hypothetical protein